jgi:general secretion pathway protein K
MVAARKQSGIALVTAVMIVAIAAAIAVQIAFAQQIWMRQIENTFDRGATDWLRRGALHWASTAIADDTLKGNTVDHLGEIWAMGLPTLPVEGGAIRVSVEDAQGRFNLNNVVRNNVGYPADIAVLQRLLQELKLDPSIVHALVDWIDPDSNTSPGGAEDIDYLNSDPPYRSADGPFERRGAAPGARVRRQTVAALAPHVTVLPIATAAVNVNTAARAALGARARPGSPTRAIAADRLTNPFDDLAEFTGRLPKGVSLTQGCCGVKTEYFLVTLETSIGHHERRSEALLQRGASGRSAELIWHRPHPLIEPDETDEPKK